MSKKKVLDKSQRWNEANFKYIDAIVSSGEIRKAFFKRCKEFEVDPYELAIKVGMRPSLFKSNYVNNPEPVCSRSFNQEKFLEMLSMVGIEIKILGIVKPYHETYVRLEENNLIKKRL